jgi:hypothetical protein
MNGVTKMGFSTISLERLHCTRRESASPTERRRKKKKHEEERLSLVFSLPADIHLLMSISKQKINHKKLSLYYLQLQHLPLFSTGQIKLQSIKIVVLPWYPAIDSKDIAVPA